MDREALARRWTDAVARFGATPDQAAAAYDDIATHYSDERRVYHTLEHVERVVTSASELRDEAVDPDAVELAAWLHDVIYDARAGDNEDRSAAYARAVLPGLGVPASTVDRVAALILTTATHDAGDDPDAAVLLDADLAVLGARPEDYDEYRIGVRTEYGWLPDTDFRAGRAALLRRLLARERIYMTATMRSRCEAAARRNMQRELEQLDRQLRG